MARRPARTTVATTVAVLALLVFGMARVAAPVSALGLVFGDPVGFGIFAASVAVAGSTLLFVRPIELAVGRILVGSARAPSSDEAGRLFGLLQQVAERARIDAGRLILRIQDDPGMNASAGATHLLFVTSGALALSDSELEAIVAHEVGHHRGLHPVLAAVVWWLRLPGAALGAVYRFLRRGVARIGDRLGRLGRALAVPALLALVVWQVTVMWLFYVGELLAMRAARLSEYEADAAAARWGYAGDLGSAYAALARRELPPQDRWARLTAEHPPLPERIKRLELLADSTTAGTAAARTHRQVPQ